LSKTNHARAYSKASEVLPSENIGKLFFFSIWQIGCILMQDSLARLFGSFIRNKMHIAGIDAE